MFLSNLVPQLTFSYKNKNSTIYLKKFRYASTEKLRTKTNWTNSKKPSEQYNLRISKAVSSKITKSRLWSGWSNWLTKKWTVSLLMTWVSEKPSKPSRTLLISNRSMTLQASISSSVRSLSVTTGKENWKNGCPISMFKSSGELKKQDNTHWVPSSNPEISMFSSLLIILQYPV